VGTPAHAAEEVARLAVSLLEAASAQTAGLYVPVSRTPVRTDLLARLGVEFCRSQRVIPVGEAQGSVVCVTTRTRDAALQRELRQRFGRPVTLRITSDAELSLAISSLEGPADPSQHRRVLADLLDALQVTREDQVSAYVGGAHDEPYLGAALVAARLITEEERLEAVGLAFNLPSINLDQHPPQADLDALLPLEALQQLRMLPLWTIDDEFFIAVVEPPNVEQMAHLQGLLGLTVRPVLVSPGQLDARLAELGDGDANTRGDILRAVTRAGLATEASTEGALRVARQTGETPEDAIARVAGVDRTRIRVALAEQAGARRYEGAPSAEALLALPYALARHLKAVAVNLSDNEATVAMVDPWDRRTVRGLRAVLRRRIRVVYVEQERFDRLVEPSTRRTTSVMRIGDPERTVRLLAEAQFVTAAGAQSVDVDLDLLRSADLPRLWNLIDNDKRSEAVALDALLPRLHQLLLRPAPEAAALRPSGADAAPILPLLREDDVLTVAISSPNQIEAARQLAGQHQLALRLAVAREDDLDTARGDLAALDMGAISEAYIAFGRVLEQTCGVRRVRVLGLFRRMQETGEALDEAAARQEVISPEDLRAAFAEYLQTDGLSLARLDRLQTTTGAGGNLVTRRVLVDPVDHELARRLPLEESTETGALPVRLYEGTMVVAMADPLDERAVTRLRRILRVPFYVQPATRQDIREAAGRAHGQITIGDRLLEADLLNREDLERAVQLSQQTGIRFGEALISLGVVSEEQLAEQLALQAGLPFITIRGLNLGRSMSTLLPEDFCRERQLIPLAAESDGTVTVAIADPSDQASRAAAESMLGRRVEWVATTRSDIRDALERLFHAQYLDYSAGDLMRRSPSESAYKVLSRGQKVFFIGLVIFLVASLAIWPIRTLTVFMTVSTFFYLSFSGYKFYLIYRALSHTLEVPVTREEVEALDDRELPVYTILVPLYKEAEILPSLVAGLSRLDYPLEKLDVKLLLEEDDTETIRVARASNLPPFFDITIVPHGEPKGKPKACNYGLLHARGRFVVIFDAEDIPEPDQLKKVIIAFNRSPEHVVCVQAKLNYYNRDQNALTKWFTTEYSTWFDLFLPGLDASGAPIPLGGTSNHFKLDALRHVGGWDPFNVTEDADLGLRIFKLGGATVVVDSTTYEEANSVIDNWIRQRSRWVKGYIQTYLVHMRNPILLWKQLGPAGFFSFQLVIGGTFFGFLLNPVLWTLTGLWFLTEWHVIQQIFPTYVFYMGATSLYVGNFAFAYMNVAGCLRRRYYSLVKWALLSPVYWVLMSIAAWKGFLQLFYRPFYWEKTIHGLSNVSGLQAAGIEEQR
jgi:glycosyltransferase XagB